MSLHNILLHQNPEKHSSHKKVTLQWCNSFPNATQTWDKLQVSRWQSHPHLREHRSAFTEKFSHRISLIQRLCAASEWHIYSRNITSMSQCNACAALWLVLTITAPSEHYIWRRCLLRAGAKGVQAVKGIISAVARRGEGITAFRVPAVYIATVTNAALGALNILCFLHGNTAGTSSERRHWHTREMHYTPENKASSQIKISSPKKGFLSFCPFFPSKQSRSLQ